MVCRKTECRPGYQPGSPRRVFLIRNGKKPAVSIHVGSVPCQVPGGGHGRRATGNRRHTATRSRTSEKQHSRADQQTHSSATNDEPHCRTVLVRSALTTCTLRLSLERGGLSLSSPENQKSLAWSSSLGVLFICPRKALFGESTYSVHCQKPKYLRTWLPSGIFHACLQQLLNCCTPPRDRSNPTGRRLAVPQELAPGGGLAPVPRERAELARAPRRLPPVVDDGAARPVPTPPAAAKP